jgi:hypothetical protein
MMHGTQNIKFIDAKQAKEIHQYKRDIDKQEIKSTVT